MSKSLKKLIDINRLREFKNKLPVFESWPAGVIIPFAGKSVPTGYLLCNGAAVSRTNYANLFAAIGTLYGAGDGSTTFNLPDARDRVLQGASSTYAVGTSIAAGLPNIYGITDGHNAFVSADGAFALNNFQASGGGNANPNIYHGFTFDASRVSKIYGASTTVQSPAIATNFIIKY